MNDLSMRLVTARRRNRIEARGGQGMTTTQAAKRQETTTERAVGRYRLHGVDRTRRFEAAGAASEGSQ